MTQNAILTGATSPQGRATLADLKSAGWSVATVEPAAPDADTALADQLRAAGMAEGQVNLLVLLHETSPQIADPNEALQQNLTTCVTSVRDALPYLAENACIVMLGTSLQHSDSEGTPAFLASKAGVNGLVRAISQELAPKVRVVAINPLRGPKGIGAELADQIAKTTLFLSSQGAGFVTGAELDVGHPPFAAA